MRTEPGPYPEVSSIIAAPGDIRPGILTMMRERPTWRAALEWLEAEATARERQRIREVIAYHRDAHNGDECLPADLLDGDDDAR